MIATATALLLAGCLETFPSPALVARVVEIESGRGFYACHVQFGWSIEETKSYCGTPDEIMPWVGHKAGVHTCWLYRTLGRSFVQGVGTPVVAVCFDTGVAQVFGLSPDALAH